MEPNQPPKTRLYDVVSLDPKDELEEKLERCHETYTALVAGLSDREAHDALNAMVCKGMQEHEEITMGLLYSILVEPTSAQKRLSDLTLISRDGLGLVLVKLNQLVTNHFSKLLESVRTQVLWLTRELIKTSVAGTDGLCLSLLKQIIGGDVSQKNVWLAESVLDVLADNRPWLDKHPVLVSISVYTYLRLVEDHGAQALATLRQKEVDFCVALLRERWTDCSVIGRDLIRLLQHVARIPEFERLWRDMITNPQTLSHQFTGKGWQQSASGLSQLMTLRTSRKFLACRLTPEMENKLLFLTSKVRFGQQQRYQDWFQRQYLSTPESQSLRCDLIRYICGVIHPSNEILCSDIVPRWALIGWLLMSCKSNVAASNAKLSLFYDWLFYQPDKDSIMNIEPAILVMHHSLRSHPHITATLLDFLCRIIPNFFPPYEAQVRQGIHTSLRQILEKRVLPSLSPLFDNPKLDKDLRVMIRDKFSEFCTATASAAKVPVEEPLLVKPEVVLISSDNDKNNDREYVGEVAFSDDEEEEVGGKVHWKFRPIKEVDESTVDISDPLRQLARDSELRDLVVQLQADSDISQDTEAQCEVVDKIVETILQMEDFESEVASPLADCLSELFRKQLSGKVLPAEATQENLCQMSEDSYPSVEILYTLMDKLYQRQPRLGYHLLYYLSVSKVTEDKARVYEDFSDHTQLRDLETCLMMDIKECQDNDISLLCYLVPFVYTQFPNVSVGNTELLNLIVAVIDPAQLQELVFQVMLGNLTTFRKESVANVLLASLNWESFEQYAVWQLFLAHDIPVEAVLPILQKANYKDHSEALTNTLLMLKTDVGDGSLRDDSILPTLEMVRYVMIRDCSEQDHFTTCILRQWSLDHEERLADLVKSMVFKFSSSTPTRKSKRSTSSRQPTPTTHQVLGHLDNLRQVCTPRQTLPGARSRGLRSAAARMLSSRPLGTWASAVDISIAKATNRSTSFRDPFIFALHKTVVATWEGPPFNPISIIARINEASVFGQEALLQALQHIQQSCSDMLKTKFSDLFALAEDFEDSSRPTRQKTRKVSNTSPKPTKRTAPREPDSSSESDTEEVRSKPPKKKKKSSATVASDSD
ncbi:Integrator complex subunit 3 [Branchiostoma belcheri]|nr:Integrator complex subunit 3 [Branchiostoma belcheri]